MIAAMSSSPSSSKKKRKKRRGGLVPSSEQAEEVHTLARGGEALAWCSAGTGLLAVGQATRTSSLPWDGAVSIFWPHHNGHWQQVGCVPYSVGVCDVCWLGDKTPRVYDHALDSMTVRDETSSALLAVAGDDGVVSIWRSVDLMSRQQDVDMAMHVQSWDVNTVAVQPWALLDEHDDMVVSVMPMDQAEQAPGLLSASFDGT
jgi:hypothetical protein